jgi:hypothetical protein
MAFITSNLFGIQVQDAYKLSEYFAKPYFDKYLVTYPMEHSLS